MEDGSEVLTQSAGSTSDAVSIVVMENTRYSYYLIATNSFGSDNSTRTNISELAATKLTVKIISSIPKPLQMFKMLPFAKSATHGTLSNASI